MLKKVHSSSSQQEGQLNLQLNQNPSDQQKEPLKKGKLEEYFSNYEKVTIDQPFEVFNNQILKNKATDVEYGVLSLLEGDWYSYIEEGSERVSNIQKNKSKPNLASGIHTTIMPSPGTTQNNIPGKFSFECDEYIEKLSFDLVPGAVRNRGGANEQFCGAVKYEQAIKSFNIDNKVSENDIQTILSLFVDEKNREKELSKYLRRIKILKRYLMILTKIIKK